MRSPLPPVWGVRPLKSYGLREKLRNVSRITRPLVVQMTSNFAQRFSGEKLPTGFLRHLKIRKKTEVMRLQSRPSERFCEIWDFRFSGVLMRCPDDLKN